MCKIYIKETIYLKIFKILLARQKDNKWERTIDSLKQSKFTCQDVFSKDVSIND